MSRPQKFCLALYRLCISQSSFLISAIHALNSPRASLRTTNSHKECLSALPQRYSPDFRPTTPVVQIFSSLPIRSKCFRHIPFAVPTPPRWRFSIFHYCRDVFIYWIQAVSVCRGNILYNHAFHRRRWKKQVDQWNESKTFWRRDDFWSGYCKNQVQWPKQFYLYSLRKKLELA